MANHFRAAQIAFQAVAANRQELRLACHAIAGKLGADVQQALLEPDVAAPICELAAQTLRAESKSFTVTGREPACEDSISALCQADQTVAMRTCKADPSAVVEDANRPDLVERLSPSVARHVAAVAALAENAKRFADRMTQVPLGSEGASSPPQSCAMLTTATLAEASKSIVEDGAKAAAALR